MHSYSRDFAYTAHIYGFLALSAWGIYWLISLAPLPSVLNVGPLISLSIFGILHLIFDRWAWRLFCLVPGVDIFDLRGTYEGSLQPTRTENFNVTFTIRQHWSRLSIHVESNGAPSNSFSAAVTKDRIQAGQVELVYNYAVQTQRNNKGKVTLTAHHGTAMLKMLEGGQRLQGEYYTEQGRNSWGTIDIVKV